MTGYKRGTIGEGSVLDIDNRGGAGHSAAIARKLRVGYPGAIYHVMNCGDRREPIFKVDVDRQRFVNGSANGIVLFFCLCADGVSSRWLGGCD